MLIAASHKDTCRGCGERIDIGDDIYWEHGKGARCEDCGPAPDEPSGAATGMEDAPGYVRVLEKRIEKLEESIEELEKQTTDDVTAIARRFDLLTAWSHDISAALEVEPPKAIE